MNLSDMLEREDGFRIDFRHEGLWQTESLRGDGVPYGAALFQGWRQTVVMLGKRHPDFQIDYEWDGDLEDCIQLIEMNQVDWKVVMEEILVQIESGEEVWITWMAERLNLLSESMGVSIPILRRINRLADEYLERWEKELLDRTGISPSDLPE